MVTGKTFDNKDKLRDAGGRWQPEESGWGFYGLEDPTWKILSELTGKEVKPDEQRGRTTEERGEEVSSDEAVKGKGKGDRGSVVSTVPEIRGSITGLDNRISFRKTEGSTREGVILVRGGCPSEQVGPRMDQKISKVLRPHQVDGARLAIAAIDAYGGFILADGTGAGKTMQILAVAHHYAKQDNKVLIVVPNRSIINDAYKRDAKIMGIDVVSVTGDQLKPGAINITTYASLNKIMRTEPDYVLFDEAHSLKNLTSRRSRYGMALADQAKGALFASATPFDKGEHLFYLRKTGIFDRKREADIMHSLGYKSTTIKILTNRGYQDVHKWEPYLSAEERSKRLELLFDELARLGIIVKREVSMDKVSVGYWNIDLPEEAHKKMADVEAHYLSQHGCFSPEELPPLVRAQMLMAQRRFQEHYKKQPVYDLAMAEIEAGRQVVIFATRTSPSHLKEKFALRRGGEIVETEEVISDTSPPTLPDLAEMFEKAGVGVSKIYGSGNVTPAINKFQKGETKVALWTVPPLMDSGNT